MEFKEKKIIVTGANRSIGRQIALAFAEQGAELVISYNQDLKGAEETVQAIEAMGQKAFAIQANFAEMEAVANFASKAIQHLGHVDVLINNAAMLCRETLFELSPEKMQTVFQVNSIAPLYLTQLCAKNMQEAGRAGCIINISSISGNMTMRRGIGYAASKAAVNKWTRNAALNLAASRIRVNAIAPGVVESGMNENTAKINPQLWEQYLAEIPLQCPGKPSDIAHMALFLASEKAEWITGKVFEVDGGHVI